MKQTLSNIVFGIAAIMCIGMLMSHTVTYSGTSFPKSTTLDTLTTTTGTSLNDTFTWTSRDLAAWKTGVTFQFNFTKISGTAGGYILIYGSGDGGASYITAPLTTVNVTSATSQQRAYLQSGNPYSHYMAVVIDTGAQSSSVQGWVYPQ